MAFLDQNGQMGTLGKIGLMLQSFADPSVIPTYLEQQQKRQEFQLKLDDLARQKQDRELQQKALSAAMPLFQSGDIQGGYAALAQAPAYAPDAMEFFAEQADPARALDLQIKRAQLAGLNAPKAPSQQEQALEFLSSLQGGAQQAQPTEFDSMMQQQGFLPEALAGGQNQQIPIRDIQAAMALENLGIDTKSDVGKSIYGKLVPEFGGESPQEKQMRANQLAETIAQIDANVFPNIDKAKNIIKTQKGTGGLAGWATQVAPVSGAFELKGAFEPITASIFLDTLIKLKRESPTGASGLGSLAIPEMEALKSRIASLKIGLKDETLIDNLDSIEREYMRIVNKARKGYKDLTGQDIPLTYGEKAPMPSDNSTVINWDEM